MSEALGKLAPLALLLFSDCGGAGSPALVVQLSHASRLNATEESDRLTERIWLSAALSFALDRAAAHTLADPAALEEEHVLPEAARCDAAGSALCAWIQAEEEAAWLAALAQLELAP